LDLAKDDLSDDERRELELIGKSEEAILSVRGATDAVMRQLEEWKLTNKLGIDSRRIEKVLKVVEKYSAIVNVAIQHHPDITALVWAGVRLIIQVRSSVRPCHRYDASDTESTLA
jgi:hypothetical protein